MDLAELGQVIVTTRKKLKLTQAALASAAGIGRVTLSQIENGSINEVGINKIIRICELLSLNLVLQEKMARPTLQQLLAEKNNHD
jgi:transcriptional regulator with XRE-family HTH domain